MSLLLPSGPVPSPLHGDLILRSCDNVDFVVPKDTLSKASSVFDDMFSIPSPPINTLPSTDLVNGTTVVPLAELSVLVAKFLKAFTGGATAVHFGSVSDIYDFYLMADKYMSEGAMDIAKAALMRRADASPVEVYMVACRLGLEAEARKAAKYALRYPLAELAEHNGKEIGDPSAPALKRLWAYHELCSKTAIKVANCDYWATNDLMVYPSLFFDPRIILPPSVFSIQPRCCTVPRSGDAVHSYYVKSWFMPFLEKLSELLQSKPSGDSMSFDEWSSLFACAVAQATQCPNCGPVAFDLLRTYARGMAARVDTLIKEVQFEF